MKGLPGRFRILLLLGLGAVVLGALGALGDSCAMGQGCGPGHIVDAVLAAASYLTLNGFDPLDDATALWVAWSTRVARALAIAFVVVGVGAVVDALLGGYGNLRFRWRSRFGSRELDLILGLSGPGLAFVSNACKADRGKTLAVDAVPSVEAIDACRRNGIPLLASGPADDATLELLNFDRIKHVFVSAGTDEANLAIVFRLAKHLRGKGTAGKKLICKVHLADVATHAPLLRELSDTHDMYVHVFNAESVTVRELYREHPLDRFGAGASAGHPPVGVHLVVLGESTMADELLLQALQLNIHEPSLSFRVQVLCAHPAQAADDWQSRHTCHPLRTESEGVVSLEPHEPWKTEKVLPRIEFHRLPGPVSELIAWCEENCGAPGWATTLIVAQREPAASAAISLSLRGTLGAMRARGVNLECWVHGRSGVLEDLARLLDVGDAAIVRSAAGSGGNGNDVGGTGIRLFSDYLGECRRDIAVSLVIEAAAERVNNIYSSAGGVSWAELAEAKRESSRQCAAHAWVKQRIALRVASPATELASAAPELRHYVRDDKDRFLATIEHRRWCAQQLLADMRPLLGHPITGDPGQWDPQDRERAREWFDSRAGKVSWMRRNRHVDLLPFACLVHLNGVRAGLGDQEQDKDLELARATDFILDGHRAGGASPEG